MTDTRPRAADVASGGPDNPAEIWVEDHGEKLVVIVEGRDAAGGADVEQPDSSPTGDGRAPGGGEA